MRASGSNSGDLQSSDLRTLLEEMRAELRNLAQRVAGLEQLASLSGSEPAPPPQREAAIETAVPAPTNTAAAVEAGISEEEVLAISAALAAWLGVQAHIRQIRLIRTGSWAQQGRVTIQTSHHLVH